MIIDVFKVEGSTSCLYAGMDSKRGSKWARSLCYSDSEKNSWARYLYVSHVPRRISAACSLFLQWSGNIECTITGARCHSPDILLPNTRGTLYTAAGGFFTEKYLKQCHFTCHMLLHKNLALIKSLPCYECWWKQASLAINLSNSIFSHYMVSLRPQVLVCNYYLTHTVTVALVMSHYTWLL